MMAVLKRKIWRLPVWLWAFFAIVILGCGIAYVKTRPFQASWRYGACKSFLEVYVRFPGTIKIREGWETSGSAGMSFSDRNPFGSEQIRVFECYFSNDKQGRVNLSKVTLDRKTLPEDVTTRFKGMLPVLAGEELNNDLPPPLPRNLEDMQDN